MAFNSNTYHANKHRDLAYEGIANAKEIKRRAAAGEAYDWELRRIPLLVSGARCDMHLSLIYRRIAADLKRRRRGLGY